LGFAQIKEDIDSKNFLPTGIALVASELARNLLPSQDDNK